MLACNLGYMVAAPMLLILSFFHLHLVLARGIGAAQAFGAAFLNDLPGAPRSEGFRRHVAGNDQTGADIGLIPRSEERRVGKECRL